MLSPDIVYQCVKISTWEVMIPLLKKISFKDFVVRVIQEDDVVLAKLVTKDNISCIDYYYLSLSHTHTQTQDR